MPRVYESPVFAVDSFDVTAGGRAEERSRIVMPDFVVVVPVTEMGEVILVEQHRHGIDGPSLECPGGRIDPGEDEITAAKRELREETGYGRGLWEPLGCIRPDASLFSNTGWLFAAHDVVPIDVPTADPFEPIRVVRHHIDDLKELLVSGQVLHAPAVVAIQRLLLIERDLERDTANTAAPFDRGD